MNDTRRKKLQEIYDIISDAKESGGIKSNQGAFQFLDNWNTPFFNYVCCFLRIVNPHSSSACGKGVDNTA